MRNFWNIVYLVCIMGLLASCATVNQTSNTSVGPGWYTVRLTDTLYSIAWRYSLEYSELARWNGIDPEAAIWPGQRLLLIEPDTVDKQPGTNRKAIEPNKKASQSAAVRNISASKPPVRLVAPSTATTKTESKLAPKVWLWPTTGTVLNTFSLRQLSRRGIDIAGKLGQSVKSTAAGKVVYSGNGLAGYGNLIIIKHSETYLSAYAYCQERLVKEGMFVEAGVPIAKMGQDNSKSSRLHFEIRKNGKPVDPLLYLVKR